MNLNIKKSKVFIILIVYLLARLGQSFFPFIQNDASANIFYPNTNIVAVIVDKDIYQ